MIEWFLTLPLWLDLPQLRVVHACWHPGHMAELTPYLVHGNKLNADIVGMGSRDGSMRFRTIEGLTKSLEVELPEDHFFIDKDGHRRTSVRTRWWDGDARTFRQTALSTENVHKPSVQKRWLKTEVSAPNKIYEKN